MKKLLRLLLGVLIVLAVGLASAPAAQATTRPYCGIYWGSLDKLAQGPYSPPVGAVYDVRTGRHTCYDRLVVDISGDVPIYTVVYRPVIYSVFNNVIPTRGGAALNILIHNPASNTTTGTPTYAVANPDELINVTGYRTFRQVVWGGTFFGYTSIGIGVRARLPFRTFVLTGPGRHSRIVVDVAHRW